MTHSDDQYAHTPNDGVAGHGISAKTREAAVHGQGPVFTRLPVPMDQLMDRQGIGGPQGLATFIDSEWEFDDKSDRFLDTIFADSD